MSWPLALIGLFGMIYSYTDSVMLGYWGMMEETGWYNAAYKVVTASLVPMGLIGASFYPALSKFSKESKEKLQRAWSYEIEIMIAIALPLIIGGMALAAKIIYSLYPADFAPSVLAFQILITTAGLIFLYRPLYDVMIVLNQQSKTFWITMGGAALNAVLNFILIPQYSLYGAAVATVFTHALVLASLLVFVKKFTDLHFPVMRILLTFSIAALASFLMYAGIRQFAGYDMSIFFLVPAGAAIYVFAFLLIRNYFALRYLKKAYV